MKKTLTISTGLLLLFLAFCYGFWFYCFEYPRIVTYAAYESVENGKEVISLFNLNHEYMKNNNKSKHSFILFSSDDKTKECPHVRLLKTRAMISMDTNKEVHWIGSQDELENSLKTFSKNLAECEKLCATFIPTFVYRGTFCISYDKDLKITGKEKPHFWD